MLASELPFEVISQVANVLTNHDKLRCSYVCKSWRVPFQESLWRHLKINSQERLYKICSLLNTDNSIFQENCYRIQKLNLGDYIHISDDDLYTLQKHLPNLSCLCTGTDCLDISSFGILSDWSLWSSLRDLEVDLVHLKLVEPERTFLNIFSGLPRLTRLGIYDHLYNKALSFSLRDIEELHECLPCLRHFSIYMKPAVLTADDLMIIPDVIPATKLAFLRFRVKNCGHQWLSYFAAKYPNIRTLEGLSSDGTLTTDIYQKDLISMFMSLSSAFQHLTDIEIHIGGDPKQLFINIWEHLYQLNVPLEHIDCKVNQTIGSTKTIEDFIERCVSLYSNSLKSLAIQSHDYYCEVWIITSTLSNYPLLVDLKLDVYYSKVALNDILNSCPGLKRLVLCAKILIVRQDHQNILDTHRLQELDIRYMSLGVSVFHYISTRCKHLTSMRLTNINIYDPAALWTSDILVSMPFTVLDVLYICNLQIVESDNNNYNLNGPIHIIKFILHSWPKIYQLTNDDKTSITISIMDEQDVYIL
ncbi:hypothetical protein CLU79DRAFT_766945 [Phycomyces nitens]|nr:hypothetical protein CLU79DRAFT_766945 [Phycomyces nitens]